MAALCEFMEFWLGPRRSSYGESPQAIGEHSLPMPLKRLYEFAGRWPSLDYEGPIQYAAPALSHQDSLAALHRLKYEGDGKVNFLCENQGVWDCRTLAEGEGRLPVWCYGDQMDEHEKWFTGERLVCDSLSRFLVTFVLQELTCGSGSISATRACVLALKHNEARRFPSGLTVPTCMGHATITSFGEV